MPILNFEFKARTTELDKLEKKFLQLDLHLMMLEIQREKVVQKSLVCFHVLFDQKLHFQM